MVFKVEPLRDLPPIKCPRAIIAAPNTAADTCASDISFEVKHKKSDDWSQPPEAEKQQTKYPEQAWAAFGLRFQYFVCCW
jgi:predicted transcriptional regulator